MDVKGHAALVTGGASGLGGATAKALVDAGAKVAILDRNEDLAQEYAKEIGAFAAPCDVYDTDSLQGAIDAAIESYQRAVDADPALPDAHYNLARLYEWRGERRLAARHMSRFRTLSHDES